MLCYAKPVLLCILLLLCQCFGRNTQVGVNNKVEGDQSVGGVHLFELHSPHGGTGLGIKILIVGLIVGGLIYWFVNRKIRKCRMAMLPYAHAAGDVSRVSCLAAYELAPVHPGPPDAMARFQAAREHHSRARRLSDTVIPSSS